MARGGGGPLCPLPLSPPRALAACVCLTAFGLQATTKEVKDSLGKQWSQLSDKKRLKWIHKALEQQKEYEVRLPLRSAPAGSSRASALGLCGLHAPLEAVAPLPTSTREGPSRPLSSISLPPLPAPHVPPAPMRSQARAGQGTHRSSRWGHIRHAATPQLGSLPPLPPSGSPLSPVSPANPMPPIALRPPALALQEIMRDYIQKHPELNISEEGITKSTLTKAERQLKDKFDGRPAKPPS